MKSRIYAYGIVGMVAVLQPSERAAADEVRLIGELTIENRTDRLPTDHPLANLPGGAVPQGQPFEFSIWNGLPGLDSSALLGETELTDAFWPEPGERFTGPVIVDFVTDGPGLVDDRPLRVDGADLGFVFGTMSSGTRRPQGPRVGVFSISTLLPPTFGGEVAFLISASRAEPDGRTDAAGLGLFRVNAIVPEPTTVAIVMTGVVVLAAYRQRCRGLAKRPQRRR